MCECHRMLALTPTQSRSLVIMTSGTIKRYSNRKLWEAVAEATGHADLWSTLLFIRRIYSKIMIKGQQAHKPATVVQSHLSNIKRCAQLYVFHFYMTNATIGLFIPQPQAGAMHCPLAS